MSCRATAVLAVLLLAAAARAVDAGRSGPTSSDDDPSGGRALGRGAGRQLLQTPTAADCDRSVKHCSACRYQFYRGTVTKAICTRCETGYSVANSGRACYCAPGFYTAEDTTVNGQVGFTCIPCGFDGYCPGAKVTPASSTARYGCGANKITTSEYAKSDRECVVKPGFGWGAGESSAECPQGFYNPGFNTRKCTKCPGSLTTLGTNSNSSQDCLAPAGYYYLRGKAVACAQGTYKEYIGNNDCDACPTGFTTAPGEVAKTSKAACKYLVPGYELRASGSSADLGVRSATECQESTYRSGYADWSSLAYAAVLCDACPGAMQTLANVTRSTTPDVCLAPPGYGWAPGGAAGAVALCAAGSYNPGWNREPCVKCGSGTITTDGEGSVSEDQCYTPAGHGNRRAAVSGEFEGYVCPNNTFGRPSKTYGLVDVECTKCLENTHTDQAGSTSQGECVTDAGYGYDDGAVNMCDYGSYSPGGSQAPCTQCGAFYNTSADGAAAATAGRLGADSADDCKPDFGWTNDTAGGLKPCIRGYYKDVLGWGACTQCPNATTTTITFAATELSDCDACRPGFGRATAMDLEAPLCEICPSGTYSYGYVSGGQACQECPTNANFTGKMVSRRGVWTPEDCVGEFVTDASMQNFLWWDVIPMDNSTLAAQAGADDVAACQSACSDDDRCQYYEFYDYPPTGERCFLRLADAPISKVEIVTEGASAGNYILFDIGGGKYTVYNAKSQPDADAVGDTIASGYPSRATALSACDRTAECVGATFSSGAGAAGWRTFSAVLWEGAVGRVRAVGETINSWLDEPSAGPV